MFKIALTPLLASAADPYVPTLVSIKAGDCAGGAQGSRTCPAVRGGVGDVQDAPRLGRPLWLPRAGATRSTPATQTRTQSGKAGSALSATSAYRGYWSHISLIFRSLRTIMSPSAQSPNAKYLLEERLFLCESSCDLSLSQGGMGRFSSTRRKPMGGCRS